MDNLCIAGNWNSQLKHVHRSSGDLKSKPDQNKNGFQFYFIANDGLNLDCYYLDY